MERISQDGHVIRLRLNAEKATREPVKVIEESIGINEASVFPGFCQEHDSEIFKPLEQATFTGTPEQLHLLAYRSICREACTKHQMVGFMLDQGMLESQLTPHGFRVIREMNWAIELLSMKTQFEDTLRLGRFNILNHCLVRFERTPQVLVSTNFIPMVTFTGRALEVRPQDRINLSIVPAQGGGYAGFSWMKSSPKNGGLFATSIRHLKSDRLTDALIRLVVEVSDNFYFSPAWWGALGKRQAELKSAFARNITMGDDTPPARLLCSTAHPIADWKMAEIRMM